MFDILDPEVDGRNSHSNRTARRERQANVATESCMRDASMMYSFVRGQLKTSFTDGSSMM